MYAMTDLITRAQAAKVLGVAITTLYRWERDGTLIPAMTLPGKTGARLYDPSEVRALAEERRTARQVVHR